MSHVQSFVDSGDESPPRGRRNDRDSPDSPPVRRRSNVPRAGRDGIRAPLSRSDSDSSNDSPQRRRRSRSPLPSRSPPTTPPRQPRQPRRSPPATPGSVGGDSAAEAGSLSRRESDEDAKAAEGAAQGHTFVQDGPSHSMAKSKNQHLLKYIIKGPLRQQPVERPLDPRYSWPRLLALVMVVVVTLYTTISFEAVCLFRDLCFRDDAGVVVFGSMGALPMAAAITLILAPIGFYGAYYDNAFLLALYLCLAGGLCALLLILASISWAESTDSAASDHASENWNSLSLNDKAYFSNNVLELEDAYQDSAIVFGVVAFVGFVLLALSGCLALVQCLWLTRPEFCGRPPRNTLA